MFEAMYQYVLVLLFLLSELFQIRIGYCIVIYLRSETQLIVPEQLFQKHFEMVGNRDIGR